MTRIKYKEKIWNEKKQKSKMLYKKHNINI